MTFYNISKITKDLIWVNYVKNVGITELIFIIDANYETQGEVVAVTKTKVLIKPFEQHNFSNQTKVLFSGKTKQTQIPTNIFGRIFDGELNSIDSQENIFTLNSKNGYAAKLNPLFLSESSEIIFDNQIQIYNGGFYELDTTQIKLFLDKVDTRNKFFVFCKIDDKIILELNSNHDKDYGEPTIVKPKNEINQIINSITNSFALCEYLSLNMSINTILVVFGIQKYIQTRLNQNSKNQELVPNLCKINESQIRSELKRNLYLKNEQIGLTVIVV